MPRKYVAECWNIPYPDSLTFVKDEYGLYVIGEQGRRPPTSLEVLKLQLFRAHLEECPRG